VVVFKIENGA